MTERAPIEQSGDREDTAHFTRHSIAGYKTYIDIKLSDDPQAAVDYDNQITPDLTESGVELAEKKAEEFLSTLDPEKDVLFFASSNEARAIETADVYRRRAHEKGFEIIKPENVRSSYAEELGEGEIRVLQNLSLNITNTIVFSVFNPDIHQNPLFVEKLDPKVRAKYDMARAIIDTHDYGSFGENFLNYSEAVQAIFPEIQSARDMFNVQFKNLIKLARFGISKARESGVEKDIKILAFGHENHVLYTAQQYFNEHGIQNCETINLNIDEDGEAWITKNGISRSV